MSPVEHASPEPVHDGDETREIAPIPLHRWVDLVRGRGDDYLVDDADFREDMKWDIEERR